MGDLNPGHNESTSAFIGKPRVGGAIANKDSNQPKIP